MKRTAQLVSAGSEARGVRAGCSSGEVREGAWRFGWRGEGDTKRKDTGVCVRVEMARIGQQQRPNPGFVNTLHVPRRLTLLREALLVAGYSGAGKTKQGDP